jgi:YgiT-type zinc finger domain-containing protein
MICKFCGNRTEKKKVKKQHWLHGKSYIVENVEAEVCTECGERYFYAKNSLLKRDLHALLEKDLIQKVGRSRSTRYKRIQWALTQFGLFGDIIETQYAAGVGQVLSNFQS